MATYDTTVSRGSVQQWWKEAGLDQLTEAELREPKEVVLELTDVETMEIFRARALVCCDPEKLPEADVLRVRDFDTDKYVSTWAVKVLERFEEPELEVNVRQDRRRLSQMKGDILRSLLERGDKGRQ